MGVRFFSEADCGLRQTSEENGNGVYNLHGKTYFAWQLHVLDVGLPLAYDAEFAVGFVALAISDEVVVDAGSNRVTVIIFEIGPCGLTIDGRKGHDPMARDRKYFHATALRHTIKDEGVALMEIDLPRVGINTHIAQVRADHRYELLGLR